MGENLPQQLHSSRSAGMTSSLLLVFSKLKISFKMVVPKLPDTKLFMEISAASTQGSCLKDALLNAQLEKKPSAELDANPRPLDYVMSVYALQLCFN